MGVCTGCGHPNYGNGTLCEACLGRASTDVYSPMTQITLRRHGSLRKSIVVENPLDELEDNDECGFICPEIHDEYGRVFWVDYYEWYWAQHPIHHEFYDTYDMAYQRAVLWLERGE